MHGNSINEETIVALRLVKDNLFKIGGPTKVKITPKLPVSGKFIPKMILKQNVSTRRELKKKKPREKQRLRKINSKVIIYLKSKMI